MFTASNQIARLVLTACLAHWLTACESQPDAQIHSLEVPHANWSRQFTDELKLGLELSINDGATQQFFQPGSDSSGSWVVDVEGVTPDTENGIVINWFVKQAGNRYGLATQNSQFFADTVTGSATLTADYAIEQFDHDNDGIANLQEVRQNTFPILKPEITLLFDPGCFIMGSPVDEPDRYDNENQLEVCLSSFNIGLSEVTFAQYDEFVRANNGRLPDDNGWGRGSRPVINISWFEALGYLKWISEMTGTTYRLPTEAEWEYAARGGTTTTFNTGTSLSTDQANFNGIDDSTGAGLSRSRTLPVGSFAANGYGLLDTHGNVFEWTCSQLVIPYDGSERVCAAPAQSREKLVSIRGGSWIHKIRDIRSANRGWFFPEESYSFVGFRVATDL